MKGDGQLAGAEVGPEVAPDLADHVDDPLPDLLGDLLELVVAQLLGGLRAVPIESSSGGVCSSLMTAVCR